MLKRFTTLLLSVAMVAISVTPAQATVFASPESFGLPAGIAPISRAASLASVAPTDNVLVTYPSAAEAAATQVESETTLLDGARQSVSVMTKADAQAFAKTHPNAVIETDKPMHLDEVNTSPSWNQDRIDQQSLPLDGKYEYQTFGKGVRIYVIDSGVTMVSELNGRVENGAYNRTIATTSNDCSGHGTSVASVAAGKTLGVAPQATIVPIRVFSCAGTGYQSYSIEALSWVASNHPGGPAVINMSLGGDYSYAYNAAVQTAIDRGFTVVVSAGNETSDACWASPASARNAITVGATDRNDAMSYFSNYGSCVDIMAPGSNIPAANMSSIFPMTRSGTSFSAPMVSGAVARALERQPRMTPAEASDWLITNSTPNLVTGLIGQQTPNRLLFVDQSGLIKVSNPSITGTAMVGEMLSADTGTWDSGTTFAYQWNRYSNGQASPISGATSSAYTIDANDLNQSITVTVTGTNSGATAVRTSAATAQVQKGTQKTKAQPKLVGTLAVGQTISVDVAEFTAGSTLSYEWFIDAVSVTTPTAGQLKLEGSNLAKKLSLKVTANLPGYNPYVVSIDAKDPVAPGTFVAKGTPAINGNIKALETVSVSAGVWDDGIALTYQWAIDGQAIDGQTTENFKLPRESVGKNLTVAITATKLGYVTETVTSAPIAIAALTFIKAPVPTIKGTATVGKKLTAYVGTWQDGTTVTYQWRRNGAPIAGATRGTYTVSKLDVGKTISVAVTGQQEYFESKTIVSKATKKVTKN